MEYNKLVRDKIPEIIESNNEEAIYRYLSDNEFKEYLKTVLNEDGERKYSDSKLDEMSYVELSLLVEEEKKLQTTKTTTEEPKEVEEIKSTKKEEQLSFDAFIDDFKI